MVDYITDSTICAVKNEIKLWLVRKWRIPKADANFVENKNKNTSSCRVSSGGGAFNQQLY